MSNAHYHRCDFTPGCGIHGPECNCENPVNTSFVCATHKTVQKPEAKDAVNHPPHYGGADNPYEAIKVIRAWELGFSLGNTVKYISRAGKKDPAKTVEDLKKARWYLDEEIAFLERKSS